jgi:hypothetical protein
MKFEDENPIGTSNKIVEKISKTFKTELIEETRKKINFENAQE